jgi:hypothetical protein
MLWLRENLSPLFNSLDVILHSRAVSESRVQVQQNISNDLDPLDNVSNVSLFEVSDGLHELGLNG